MRLRVFLSRTTLSIVVGCGTATPQDASPVAPPGRGADAGPEGSSEAPGPVPGGEGASEIHHLLVTGQSNSIGFAGVPVLTTAASSPNVMFDTGVMTATGCDDEGCRGYGKPTSLVPLREGDSYFAYAAETMTSALANAVSKRAGTTLLGSVHGRSGNTYECLRKGGCGFLLAKGYTSAFAEGLRQVEDAKTLVAATGKRYRVGAVAVIHGESDHYANPYPLGPSGGAGAPLATYADALREWQRDYDAAIRALTAQTESVPLLVSQMSNWNDRPTSDIPVAQLAAHVRGPREVALVGPTYMLPFADDCIHFTNHGVRRLGEYFAKAYTKVVVERGTWEPLRPLSATSSGSTIRVRFAVPTPPLVLDTTAVADPGSFGFEVVTDAGSPVAISDVQIVASDTVAITMAAPPTTPLRVRYAMTAVPQTCPGPQTGPRGNLRDSDGTPSDLGYPLQNWAVHFDMDVK